MNKNNEKYFHSKNRHEVEKEKGKHNALHSFFFHLMGRTEDKTKYIGLDNNKISIRPKENTLLFKNDLNSRKDGSSLNLSNAKNVTRRICNPKIVSDMGAFKDNNLFQTEIGCKRYKPIWGNPKNVLTFEKYSSFQVSTGVNKSKHDSYVNDNMKLKITSKNKKKDSLWYDNGYLNVTFRNDLLGNADFSPYRNSDYAGCKRRCMEMLKVSGGELSGARIDMTVNDEYGRPISPSHNFRKGIEAINKSLDNGKPIILNVDYKKGHASSADKAGDHFIIVVGKTIIDNVVYYHFYDPATSNVSRGTSNRNVLYVKDGYLYGIFFKTQWRSK